MKKLFLITTLLVSSAYGSDPIFLGNKMNCEAKVITNPLYTPSGDGILFRNLPKFRTHFIRRDACFRSGCQFQLATEVLDLNIELESQTNSFDIRNIPFEKGILRYSTTSGRSVGMKFNRIVHSDTPSRIEFGRIYDGVEELQDGILREPFVLSFHPSQAVIKQYPHAERVDYYCSIDRGPRELPMAYYQGVTEATNINDLSRYFFAVGKTEEEAKQNSLRACKKAKMQGCKISGGHINQYLEPIE